MDHILCEILFIAFCGILACLFNAVFNNCGTTEMVLFSGLLSFLLNTKTRQKHY